MSILIISRCKKNLSMFGSAFNMILTLRWAGPTDPTEEVKNKAKECIESCFFLNYSNRFSIFLLNKQKRTPYVSFILALLLTFPVGSVGSDFRRRAHRSVKHLVLFILICNNVFNIDRNACDIKTS